MKHRDGGQYLCSASSGMTTVTDPPIYLTVLPGVFYNIIMTMFKFLIMYIMCDSVGMYRCVHIGDSVGVYTGVCIYR